jgi:hypothetical protein
MANDLGTKLRASLAVTPARNRSREDLLTDVLAALKSNDCLAHVTTAFHTMEDSNFTHRYHLKRAIAAAASLRADLDKFLHNVGHVEPTVVPVEGGGAILVPPNNAHAALTAFLAWVDSGKDDYPSEVLLNDAIKMARAVMPPVNQFDEQSCPGHVASDTDPKICGRCGVHIDSLRPDDGEA